MIFILQADESRGFTEYLKERHPVVGDPNPWLLEFWKQHFQCTPLFTADSSPHERTPICTGEETLVDTHFVQDDKVRLTIRF